MKACLVTYYWTREFTKLGNDERIMASKFIIPYRQNEKNDEKGICEAATRPKTVFVSIKSEEQLSGVVRLENSCYILFS